METEEKKGATATDKFMDNLHEYCRGYVDMGLSIFPLAIDSKKPLAEWKQYQSRRATLEEVDDWFSHGAPTSSGDRVMVFNIAIATGSISGLVVLDCDNTDAVLYAIENGMFSDYVVNTTRGKHFYFQHPSDHMRYSNKVGGTARDWHKVQGLDFRGDGGYVVAPPSVSFNNDGTLKHQYQFAERFPSPEYLPMWVHSKASLIEVTEEFTFDKLNLSDVSTKSDGVWDQAQAHIMSLSRKLRDGDGRNNWLARYAGECVSNGIIGARLETKCHEFCEHFFFDPLPRHEFDRTLESIQDTEKRNNPERFKESTRSDKEVEIVKASKFKPITVDDIDEIERNLGNIQYFAEPLLSPGTITHVSGYTGHGKSMFIKALCWAVASGSHFGPFEIYNSAKVLYLDFELPASTLTQRMRLYKDAIGNPHQNMAIWSSSLISADQGGDMNLTTEAGLEVLAAWINEVMPKVVVFDTVRSAFPGFKENDADQWGRINKMLKKIRNLGCAVVMVHHKNKPQDGGYSREAGSTAQLTDVDTQIFIDAVYANKDESERRVGLFNGADNVMVHDSAGKAYSPYDYLKAIAPKGYNVLTVLRGTYGKLRQKTEMHETFYLGVTQCVTTGRQGFVSTLSPRQKARCLHEVGLNKTEIAERLFIPATIIQKWIL